MKTARAGAIGGVLGAVAHMLVMFTWFRFLPRREQYPLPPRENTTHVLCRAGLLRYLGGTGRQVVTWISHFVYGALAGLPFAPFVPHQKHRALTSGCLYGVVVWAVSTKAESPCSACSSRPANILPAATR